MIELEGEHRRDAVMNGYGVGLDQRQRLYGIEARQANEEAPAVAQARIVELIRRRWKTGRRRRRRPRGSPRGVAATPAALRSRPS